MNKVKLVIVSILICLGLMAAVMSVRLLIVGGSVDADYDFEIVFLDVGEGDAIYIRCGKESMLVDGGSPEYSQHIYSFLKNREITDLKYVVCTHAHDDHVGGLAAALNYAKGERFFCPSEVGESRAFDSFLKYVDQQGGTIEHPQVGDVWKLGDADITVIGPIHVGAENLNNDSIVLKIVYGVTTFILTGDAEIIEEDEILAYNKNLKCDVLKVGHHGSDTSTSDEWVNALSPKNAVISVGIDNTYGHPKQSVLDRLQAAGTVIYRTDLQGDIVCRSNGVTLKFEVNGETANDNRMNQTREVPVAVPGMQVHENGNLYILNTRSHRFHYENCEGVRSMSENNKEESYLSRDELIEMGYEPCQICNP